jgi:hypothetical protein
MWHAYRYLIVGRKKWEVMWVDPAIIPNPRVWLEVNLVPKAGPLLGVEPVPGVRPLTDKEAMAMANGQGTHPLVRPEWQSR